MQFLAAILLLAGMLCWPAAHAMASPTGTVRLGYLDHPGSALCQIAEAKGHFREEGLQVELVRFTDSSKGLAALESGAIDVGAFRVDDSLRAIAAGKGFRIIAGGGTLQSINPLAELDDVLQTETDSKGIVVLIPPTWPNAAKGTIIQLTAALIRAYRTRQQQPLHGSKPGTVVHFDPNPDYWRLERIWRTLGLQDSAMKRDFLANHVYEEIYCDALDRMLLGHIDSTLQQLFSKAVCTPNCCPASAAKL
jgi:hypothetical protein